MKRHYVDTNLAQVHVVTEGAGKPLVLLGPAGRSTAVFSALIPLLSRRFRVVCLDLPGSGNSDPLPAGASIEALAQCVVCVLDAFELDRTSVYGLHTGNKIGAALAAHWPSRVDDLVLCGQSHSIIPSREERNRVIGTLVHEYFDAPAGLGKSAAALHYWAKLNRRICALWWPDELFTAEDSQAAVAYAKTLVLDEILAYDGTAALYQANFNYDLEADMRRISARTLVIEIATPREDKLIGRQGPLVQSIVAGASLATLEADGFILTLEDRAADIAEILLRFLR